MKSQKSTLVFSFLVGLSVPLLAQDAVPLQNWSAPQYWRPAPSPQPGDARTRVTRSGGAPVASAAADLPLGSFALVFVAMPPCRVVDTRAGSGFTGGFGPPSLVGGSTRNFLMQNSTTCSIPAVAKAYSLNVTVVPPGFLGFITVFPGGTTRPNASTLNDPLGVVIANATIVSAGADAAGSLDVYANNATDLIVDINGYYATQEDANQNIAIGIGTLANNTTGRANTAVGDTVLLNNTTGIGNTGVGAGALVHNISGLSNTATGTSVLFNINSGSGNTAMGDSALYNMTSGSGNIALGSSAGISLTAGSNNILIGNQGIAGDTGIIRIGDVQTQTFIAGINGASVGASSGVLINSNGQLGTQSSSRRYKEDIHDMGEASNNLLRLRPVTYRYRKPYPDGSKPIDYGLIAEEVAEVYPDLVVKNKDGQIETVQYQKLTPMLLNEAQKQHVEIEKLHLDAEKQSREIEALRAKLAGMPALEARLAALEALLSSKVPTVATSGQ